MRPVPWKLGDLLVLYVCTLGGLVLVGVGWFGTSSSVVVGDQVRWVVVGAAGVIVLGAGNLAWLLTGRRAVGELRRRLVAERRLLSVPPSASTMRLVSGPNMTRAHLDSCPLVAGKPVATVTATDGLRRCGVCGS